MSHRTISFGLSGLIAEFLESQTGIVSPQTTCWYTHRLNSLGTYLGASRDIRTIDLRELRQWRAQLVARDHRWETHPTRPRAQGALSPWTLHGYVRAVRHFFKWCADEGWLVENPARRLELPPLPDEPPKGVSRNDIEKMLRIAQSHPRDYALVLFLADTGARVGGAAGLRWMDAALEERRATVREKGRGGKRKARPVYFGARTQRALKCLRDLNPQADHVFIGCRGNRLTEGGIYLALKRIARQAGVTRWNPHAFRHAFAREMLQRGASLAHVAQMLGHRDPAITTRFYARFADSELRQAHTRYSWLR